MKDKRDMSESRKCSIITVSYNSEKTIEQTIKSVLNQTYSNIEYIIIDGASTDHTMDIVKMYSPIFKGRMSWVSEPDEGIYYAMNKGIELATGDIIGIINSDDYYEKDAVMNIMDALGDSEGSIILYGMMRMLRNGIEDNICIYSPEFLENRSIAHPSCFVTKKLYEEYGSYDTNYISASDYDFFLRMRSNADIEFRPVYKLIANFNAGGMSGTSKAYLDLLRVKRKHNLITKEEYRKIILKGKMYDIYNCLRRRKRHGV